MGNPNLHEKTLTYMRKTLTYTRKNPNLHEKNPTLHVKTLTYCDMRKTLAGLETRTRYM